MSRIAAWTTASTDLVLLKKNPGTAPTCRFYWLGTRTRAGMVLVIRPGAPYPDVNILIYPRRDELEEDINVFLPDIPGTWAVAYASLDMKKYLHKKGLPDAYL